MSQDAQWPIRSSGSGGISSINGDTTAAQLIVGGTGINVATSAGTTTITNTVVSGANTALSNLASTAVNASIIPGANGSIDLGSTTKAWRSLYLQTVKLSSGVSVIDIPNTLLTDVSNVRSILWNSRELHDGSDVLSLLWNDRQLADNTGGQVSIDWGLRQLTDSTGVIVLSWDERNLLDSSTAVSVDWENRQLLDSSENGSILWQDRLFIDASQVESLEYDTRRLLDESGLRAISWKDRILYDTDSVQIATFDGANSGLKVVHITGGLYGTTIISALTGAGTSPTISISGNDAAGKITVTIGTLPATSAGIVKITFALAYTSAPIVVISPANAATAALSATTAVFGGSETTTDFTITAGTVALTPATQYIWNYHVIGR